jgi:hypothetical protein
VDLGHNTTAKRRRRNRQKRSRNGHERIGA